MTASNRAACLAFTLRYEGGKVDNPKDRGGRTNQGVTQATFAAWLAKCGAAPRSVYTMTPAERDAIYASGFWSPIKGDQLGAGVDLAVFDFGVNSGPARALRAHAKRGSNDDAATVKAVCANRLSLLHALGTFKTFGRGWTARVAACEALGVKMAEHARIGVAPDAITVPQVAGKLIYEAAMAKGKAKTQRKSASSTALVGGGVGLPLASTDATHLPMSALAVVGAAIAITVALLLWRAHQQSARATAYAAVAAGA